MLCLTVYESKGLEFEDVILFNFFMMGEIKSDMWKLLNQMKHEQIIGEAPHFILDWDQEELDRRMAEKDDEIVAEYE